MKLLSKQKHAVSFLVLSLFASAANAWEPRPGWRDSYAVAGICYCDSSNFDHGIGKVKLMLSDGYQRSVRQICTDITTEFGVGPQVGRIPYNTIACGNAPANDAPDEDLITGCPGRVDQGEAGCFEIGPQWPLDTLYGAPIKSLDRSAWKISASDKDKDTAAMADGNPNTRWSTNRKQSPGQWLEIDLGQAYKINVVDLEAVGSRDDFPVAWTLEVSAQGELWEVAAVSTESKRAVMQQGEITRIQFPDTRVQRLRITQTGQSKKYFWSVHELHIGYLSAR